MHSRVQQILAFSGFIFLSLFGIDIYADAKEVKHYEKSINELISDIQNSADPHVRSIARIELERRTPTSPDDVKAVFRNMRVGTSILYKINDKKLFPAISHYAYKGNWNVFENLEALYVPELPITNLVPFQGKREQRALAVHLLAVIGDESIINVLLDRIDDRVDRIAATAAYGVARILKEEAIPILGKRLKGPKGIRVYARALMSIGDQGVRYVIAALRDGTISQKDLPPIMLSDMLSDVTIPNARDILLELSRDPNPDIRDGASFALFRMDSDSGALLKAGAASASVYYRNAFKHAQQRGSSGYWCSQYALESLYQFALHNESLPDSDIPIVISSLEHCEFKFSARQNAKYNIDKDDYIKVLSKTKSAHFVDALIEVLSKDGHGYTTGAWAIDLLGEIGNDHAVDALMNCSGNMSSKVITALGRLGDKRALPLVLKYAELKSRYDDLGQHNMAQIIALAQLGQDVKAADLLAIMDKGDLQETGGIDLLRGIRQNNAKPLLFSIFNNTSIAILPRLAAANALASLGEPVGLPFARNVLADRTGYYNTYELINAMEILSKVGVVSDLEILQLHLNYCPLKPSSTFGTRWDSWKRYRIAQASIIQLKQRTLAEK